MVTDKKNGGLALRDSIDDIIRYDKPAERGEVGDIIHKDSLNYDIRRRKESGTTDILPESRDLDYGDFSFCEFSKTTKRIRKIQAKIDCEFSQDSSGMKKAGYAILKTIKEFAGIHVETIKELFVEEEECVRRACDILASLYTKCSDHYETIAEYRSFNNQQAGRLLALKPSFEESASRLRENYLNRFKEMSRIRRDDPRYYFLRDEVSKARDSLRQGTHQIMIAENQFEWSGNIANRVDLIAQILLFGRSFAQKVGIHYKNIEAHLISVVPSLNLIRTFLRYAPQISELNDHVSKSIMQAESMEEEFEKSHLLSRITQEIPSLPSDSRMGSVVDFLNSSFERGQSVDKNTRRCQIERL